MHLRKNKTKIITAVPQNKIFLVSVKKNSISDAEVKLQIFPNPPTPPASPTITSLARPRSDFTVIEGTGHCGVGSRVFQDRRHSPPSPIPLAGCLPPTHIQGFNGARVQGVVFKVQRHPTPPGRGATLEVYLGGSSFLGLA